MTKQKILILIPLLVIGALLIYCWTIILTTEILATWRHYVALIFFIGVGFLSFKSIIKTTIATGLYLLLATFNLLAITPTISISWFIIGPISTPPVQLLSFGLFVLYLILNFDSIVNIYLDYKEAKRAKT